MSKQEETKTKKDKFYELVNEFVSQGQAETNKKLLEKGKSKITRNHVLAYILAFSKGIDDENSEQWKKKEDKEWFEKHKSDLEVNPLQTKARNDFLEYYKIKKEKDNFNPFDLL